MDRSSAESGRADLADALASGLCTDVSGMDRTAVHAKLNAEIVDFFDRKLPKPD
jgi:hypothetical protein